MAEESQRPLKVFLCHAHGDKDAVRELYNRLKRDGVDAWLDKEKLLPGMDWAVEIRKAVAQSDVVIVCLSKQFNQEGFRQKEVRIALEAADMKTPETIFIMPVRLEECEVPDSLSRWHWVNLFEKDGYRILHRALTVRAGQIGANLPHKKSGTTRLARKEISQPIIPPQKSKVIEAAKPVEEKPSSIVEKLPKQDEAPKPANNTEVARNVADSVIVTGNNNVIHVTPAPVKQEEKKSGTPKPKVEKPVERKNAKKPRKLSAPIIIVLLGLIGTIYLALIIILFINSWLVSSPTPTLVSISIPTLVGISTPKLVVTPTTTRTLIYESLITPEPPTETNTPELPTETFTSTPTLTPPYYAIVNNDNCIEAVDNIYGFSYCVLQITAGTKIQVLRWSSGRLWVVVYNGNKPVEGYLLNNSITPIRK